MYLASNKTALVTVLMVLASVIWTPVSARAESGSVSLVGSGKDSAEAIAALLRVAVAKHLKSIESSYAQAVLKNEILPSSTSFVQSYRILEGGRNSFVNLSASVDLDVLRALYALTPKALSEEAAKVFIVVKGAKLPPLPPVKGKSPPEEINPYLVLEAAAKDRFARRSFELVSLPPEEVAASGAGDDISAPELLRGLGAKAVSRLALGISSRFETVENENSHNPEERVMITASLVDVKSGQLLARESASILSPKSKRELYAADLQRVLADESRDIMQSLLVQAGKKIGGVTGKSAFAVLRVLYPSHPALLARFRSALESVKELKSVTEYRIRRGAFDLAITPAMESKALAKLIKAMPVEDLVLSFVEGDEIGEGEPTLVVKLAPKVAPEKQGGSVEEP
jgi:hypothetical protein